MTDNNYAIVLLKQSGLLVTLQGKQLYIFVCRLFLGGPLSVRGFQMKGIGPKDEGIIHIGTYIPGHWKWVIPVST